MGKSRNEVTAKETRALEMRAQGRSMADIAEELGYADESGASRAVSRALGKHQTVAVDEFRGFAWGQLDEIGRRALVILERPDASDADQLRALDLLRRILQDRGELVGYSKALERAAQAEEESQQAETPEMGPGFLNVISLDGAPIEVLPRELEAVGVVPPNVVVVHMDPDWQLPPSGVAPFSRDGKLKRGNTLLRCEPEALEPFLAWKAEQREERWRAVAQSRGPGVAAEEIIVDP